jgi:hypothetical protein
MYHTRDLGFRSVVTRADALYRCATMQVEGIDGSMDAE